MKTQTRAALRLAIIYLVVGILWILFSDMFVGMLSSNPETIITIQMVKGWFYVFITAALAFAVVRLNLLEIGELKGDISDLSKKSEGLMSQLEQQEQAAMNLVKARQMLEMKNETLVVEYTKRSEFLHEIAHEMRNALHGIIGCSELLRSEHYGPLNAKQRTFAETIEESCDFMQSFADDLVDLARFESGNLEAEYEKGSLEREIKTLCSMFQKDMRDKKITLELMIHKGLDDVIFDRRKLRQILLNVLNNALKYSNEGGEIGIIASFTEKPISKERAETTGTTVPQIAEGKFEIKVVDNGIGIDEEDLKHIFDEHFQSKQGRLLNPEGSGIGLAVSKRLIEFLGGKITVKSKVGKGATFKITFPAAPLHIQQQFRMVQKARGPSESEYQVQFDQPVLIVDNSASNALVLSNVVQSLGHMTEIARNGQEALNKCKEKEYKVVFLDLRMPEMGGFQTIKLIRELPSYRHTPIYCMTASSSMNLHQECVERGFNACLEKPFSREKLAGIIGDQNQTENNGVPVMEMMV